MANTVFAHEGEVHESSVESTAHYLDFLLEPVFAILTFAVLGALIVLLLRKIRVHTSKISLVVLSYLFVSGILGFLYVPLLGVLAITLGFTLTLVIVFVGIKGNKG